MTRYFCWSSQPSRLAQSLAGWSLSLCRACLPQPMMVGGQVCLLQELSNSVPSQVLAAYRKLSEETVYLRFMGPKRTPSLALLSPFLTYNPAHQVGLMLLDHRGAPVAMAQSIRRRKHPERAEFSCVVADHFQQRGAGRRILLALALLARAEGINEWIAEVLAQNQPMLGLLKTLGLPLTLVTGRELVFVRLDLTVLDRWILQGTWQQPKTKGE
ncbi:GNAT family N-acetyltransferase [Aeromonas cavernicola]|uniref:GNAT family N-acetyltransferase n=1 Tax=Aeromonas cavernicola TaxID=1006623 RepID=A0A2H9U0U1_9GAMM|nr:GNAT family N-acetyltransferase [Aeromonas cavernicola]PJG57676.1 GNAT family N-acetyltransferase [Aeromonas cavernicola]